MLDLKTDQFKAVEVPGAQSTDATAINNLGQVAGTYIDGSGSIHAFVDTFGHFEFLQMPANIAGTLKTVSAINDLGQIVGQFVGSNDVTESFIATPHDVSKYGIVTIFQDIASRMAAGAPQWDIRADSVPGLLNLGHG